MKYSVFHPSQWSDLIIVIYLSIAPTVSSPRVHAYDFYLCIWYLRCLIKTDEIFSLLSNEVRNVGASQEDGQWCLPEVGNTFHGLGWGWRREWVVRKWRQKMQTIISIILAIKGRGNTEQCIKEKIGSNQHFLASSLPISSSLALH